jgi:hypothetical protein
MKMKIFPLPALTFAVAVMIISCSKSNEADVQNPGGTPAPGPGSCDTVNMKYTSNVLPIISSKCYGCHGNGAINGGVELDSYSKLLVQVNNGKLIGVISHAPGFKQMPQGGTKLSDCDINKIKSWISRGAQNN